VYQTSYGQHKKKVQWYNSDKKQIHVSYHVLANKPNIIDSMYQEFYPTGVLKSSGNYLYNKPEGIWSYYHENGQLRMTGEVKDFQNHGHWIYYYENGSKYMEGSLSKGIKKGEWIIYFDNGKIKSKGNYEENKAAGPWYYFYEDGAAKAVTYYENGRGMYREYYKAGQLKMEGILSDGKSDSVWNYYYENGKLKATGLENTGLKDGFWKYYHENGLLASEGLYLNGVPFGNWRYYFETGTVSMEGSHKEGEKDGFWKLYYPTGEFKAETQFNLGEGPYKEYFESGKVKVTGYIKKGANEGPWVYFYEDGTCEGKCNFRNGEGDFTGYYPDGKVKMEGKIEDGVKIGVWKLYKPQGELAGYYRTYYENKETVFVPLENDTDSIISNTIIEKKDSLIANKKTDKEGKSTSIKRKRVSKIRYFRPKQNEYRAFIISTNPLGTFLYRQLPLYLEYLAEERLGYQFVYSYLRSPFFSNPSKLEDGIISNVGHTFELMQKFYHPNKSLGSLYFGHSIKYRTVHFNVDIADTTTGSDKVFNYRLKQESFEYAIIGGDRIFLNNKSDKAGWTIDLYIGLAAGILTNNFNPSLGYFPATEVFDEVPQLPFYMSGKLGISFGYMF
jgi:antitoxin component YwqK of YwqJK toxin-antitoxin module